MEIFLPGDEQVNKLIKVLMDLEQYKENIVLVGGLETKVFQSELNVPHEREDCSVNVLCCLYDTTSQRMIVPLYEPEARIFPSGLNETLLT